MSRTRWTTVLACLALAALISWAVSDLVLSHRGWVPALTPWTAAVALGVSTVVLVCGFAVRRLREYAETGRHPGNPPTPGVFARHNAVDTPALLPDGSPAEGSVSPSITERDQVRGGFDQVGDVVRQLEPEEGEEK